MLNFSIITQEDYPLPDLDSLLSKDNITEDDFLQLPELVLEEQRNSPSKTLLNQKPENLAFTPIGKSRIALNDTPKKRKSNILSRQFLQRQKKSEEATLKNSFNKKHKSNFI